MSNKIEFSLKSSVILISKVGSVAVPGYRFTDAAKAISSIFPPNDAAARFVQMLKNALPGYEVIEHKGDSPAIRI